MKCIYHQSDIDGILSAAIVFKKYPHCECIPHGYGREFPMDKINYNEQIFLVDLSLPPYQMKELDRRSKLVWIDHHRKAIEDSKGYNYDDIESISSWLT